ncbi:MAG: hypothetical protein GWO24_05180, partial [Akkermansiaceae bacterium]|nr:hypothetical protein [Akkermansiaceae bacterium]
PRGERIILGDVGEGDREEIDLIEAGKNYGWKYFEGLREASPPPPGFVHQPPLYEYAHGPGEFRGDSVTGGVVYHQTDPGHGIPELDGLYIFADYATGNVWSLDLDDPYNTVQRLFGDTGIITFGYDPSNGDVLYGSNKNSAIKRLARTSEREFPKTLTESGVFSNLATLEPSPSVLPYAPRVPFWSDHAVKRRWFSVPTPSGTITYSRDGNWAFPSGSFWVKHLDLELERGNPATARRIETRILVKNDHGIYGVSYRWNESETEAYLVEDAGADLIVEVDTDPGPGQSLQEQILRIPSRAECLACHTPAGGFALSFNTRQLNHVAEMGGLLQNQLQTLSEAGYLDAPVTGIGLLPRLARADESDHSLEFRVRSYLAVNCSQCHQPGTGAPESWDARAHLTTEATGIIDGNPENNGGDPANKLIAPGSENNSVILQRMMGSNGFARMPNL